MTSLPLEIWCLIFKWERFKDDLRDLFLCLRVSKSFYEIIQFVLNHNFRIKGPRNVKKSTISFINVCHRQLEGGTEKYHLYEMYCDSDVVKDIDILYQFFRHFSGRKHLNFWKPVLNPILNVRNYFNCYFLRPPNSRNQRVIGFGFNTNPNQFLKTKDEVDDCIKLLENLEQKTTLIRLGVRCYCLFEKFHSQ